MKSPTVEDIDKSSYETLLTYCKKFSLNSKGKDSYLRERLRTFLKKNKVEMREKKPEKDEDSSFDTARLLIKLDKPKKALKILESIGGKGKHYWLEKGNCYLILGKSEKALECFDNALTKNKNFREALMAKEHLLSDLSRYEEALEINDILSQLNPEKIQNLLARAIFLQKSGKHLEAIRICELITQNNEYEHVYNMRGLLLMKFERFGDALKCFKNALNTNENFPEAWNNKGVCLFKLGLRKEADEAFQRAIDLRSEYGTAWHNRGLLAYSLGKMEDAGCYFEEALKHMPTGKAWSNLGLVYLKQSKLKNASECFERAIELDSTNPEAWRNKGLLLERRKKHSQAKKCFEKARTLQPDSELIEKESDSLEAS